MAARGVDQEVLARRVRAQWLAERPGTAVAAQTAGLQAHDPYATRLGVRVRSRRLTADAVAAAYAEPGVLVRTWLMRGTLHLVAAADVRWMLLLFGDRNVAANARRRAELGLDEATCGAALDALPRLLADGPLS